MTVATARYAWWFRAWPIEAKSLLVGSEAWNHFDKNVPRHKVEATEKEWVQFCGSLIAKGYEAREVFRVNAEGKPEAIAW